MISIFSALRVFFIIDLESLEFKKFVINICNKIIVRTFIDYIKNNMKLLCSSVSTKGKASSFLTLKIYSEQPIFSYWHGVIAIVKKFHEEHKYTYSDFSSTFLSDKFAFRIHLQAQNGPL